MSRVIVIVFVSLDGVVHDPDGGEGSRQGGWGSYIRRRDPAGRAGPALGPDRGPGGPPDLCQAGRGLICGKGCAQTGGKLALTAENQLSSVDKVWITKNSPLFSAEPLRDDPGRSRNTFTVGNGHRPGGDFGNVTAIGKPVSGAGARHQRAALGAWEVRQLADRALCGQTRPPPSHTWRGPCSIIPGRGSVNRDQRGALFDHYRTARA
jgi:hypothetical protein